MRRSVEAGVCRVWTREKIIYAMYYYSSKERVPKPLVPLPHPPHSYLLFNNIFFHRLFIYLIVECSACVVS